MLTLQSPNYHRLFDLKSYLSASLATMMISESIVKLRLAIGCIDCHSQNLNVKL